MSTATPSLALIIWQSSEALPVQVRVSRLFASLHPGAKVLFMSGYTDDAVVRRGMITEGGHFLQKPFTPASLAAKVREVLDATS